MHGWLLTIAIFTPQPAPTSQANTVEVKDAPLAVETTDAVVDTSKTSEEPGTKPEPELKPETGGEDPNTDSGSQTPSPNTATAPPSDDSKTDPKVNAEGARIALEYRANRAFEIGDYWKATTIWARLANREQPGDARDGYVLRAVSAADLMFDEYGERRALCLGHQVLSTHLRAGRSEGQQYFVNRRRELTAKLVDHLGERWPYACRQLLRESSFGETPPTPVVRIQSSRPAPVPALPEGDATSCDPPKDQQESSCAGFSNTSSTSDRPKRRPLLIAGATLTSLGTATLLGTVTSSIFYKQRQLELRVLAENAENGPLTPAELELATSNAHSATRLKNVVIGTGIVGGAQLVAGVVMLVVDARQQKSRRASRIAVAPLVSPSLAGGVLSGSF
ncbi:MAG: hypothetical protein ACPG4T_08480 [Nannocystaceae bacterium]